MRNVVVVLLCTLSAMTISPSQGSQRPSTAAATAPATAPTSTNGFGPIAYYEESCSRCHGQFGTGYLPDMGQRLSDDALRKVIHEMAEGPAAAPLNAAQLEAETAYHRSFIDGTPFLARTGVDPLQGEVTDGAAVTITVNGKTAIPVVVEGHTWRVDPAVSEARGDDVTIVAERDKKRTTLDAGIPFSHADPRR